MQEAHNKRVASGLSAVGGIIGTVPHPVTDMTGRVLQLPDTYYDVKDLFQDPNIVNAIHVGLDVPQLIPGVAGDVLNISGIIDDDYSYITRKDGIENIKNKIKNSLQTSKPRNKNK